MMAPISQKVVAGKVETIRRMLRGVDTLPLADAEKFAEDFRMVSAGESMLRRTLEALLDLGRHIAAKGFSRVVVEYKQIGKTLGELEVLGTEGAAQLVGMAGYRNRLTHFYDEVTPEELHRVLTEEIGDINSVLDQILAWLRDHPENVDTSL